MKSKKNGFTFIEVIIVIIINAIIMFSVGMILIQTRSSMEKGKETISLESDYRFCRYKMEKEFRRAIDTKIIMNSGKPNEIEIYCIDGDTETLKLDVTNKIIEQKTSSNNFTQIILKDVTSLDFSVPVSTYAIKVDIVQEKIIADTELNTSNSFIVNLRNKF